MDDIQQVMRLIENSAAKRNVRVYGKQYDRYKDDGTHREYTRRLMRMVGYLEGLYSVTDANDIREYLIEKIDQYMDILNIVDNEFLR